MKKTVYTLSIDNYAPKLLALTVPLMKKYAKKIGADFHVISERKFPGFPIPYEKFQLKELTAKRGDEWSLFFDADTLIHPDMWDPTEVVGKEMTISNGSDFVPIRFKPDKYFKRDGRFIGKGNWLICASDWCQDIWSPLDDMTPEEAAKQITCTLSETSTVIEPKHLIDDYTVSRNISRYGLDHILLTKLLEEVKAPAKQGEGLLWHHYLIDIHRKEYCMKKVLLQWVVNSIGHNLFFDPLEIKVKAVLNDWDYFRTNIDWDELLAIVPYGEKIAGLINSWGIELKVPKIASLSITAKRQLLMFALEPAKTHPRLQAELQNIANLPSDVNLMDYINSSEFRDVIMGSIQAWGIKL